MLLRTRVTLIVSVTYSLLVAGMMFAGLKSEELADERYAQATLNGQEIFWRKLVENTVQRLEADARTVGGRPDLAQAVERRDPSAVLTAVAPLAEGLKARGRVTRFELMASDGELLYNSRGSLLEPPTLDAGTARTIVDTRKPVRGVQQDASKVFTATLAVPLELDSRVVGLAVLAADMHPPLQEFKESTGSDIFLVDRAGQLALGTDDGLWSVFDGKVSVRKSRLETRQDGQTYYSVAVLPLYDGSHRVIGALITARDVTATQARLALIRQVSIAAVIGFLLVVLGVFYVYMRKSFHPLDEAIRVLNALSRGDTSVTLDVKNNKDEIGRIAGTVGVFRENAVALEMLQERRERQRRRQELFIRLQMQNLSEMLEEDARAAVLADLKQIEAMAERAEGGQGGKGELEVLGVAFQTMSNRIREQHERLEGLIAERTRDVEILREALRTRDQLAVLRQELDFARELQLSSLPQVFPPFPDRTEFQIHAGMVPAKEVGGDFYDFFLIDRHHLGFVIGDASGKGVPAAMFIAITRSLIKAVAPLSASPGECLAFVNTMLAVDNPQTLFATCFYAVLDTRTGEVAFCNAGHPPALILRAGTTEVEAIRDVSGVALGVMEDLEYDTGTFTLNNGDVILLYTDGVTEAQNVSDALYDEPRLIEAYRGLGGLEPAEVIDRVHKSVEAFVGDAPQFDDITMLTLRLDGLSEDTGGEEGQRRLALTGFKAAPAPAEAAPAPAPAAPKPSVTVQAKPAIKAKPALKAKITPKPKPKAAPAPTPAPVPEMSEPETPAPASEAAPADYPRLDVTISNDLGELQRLAMLVDEFVERNALPERIAFNLNLCLDELITNIVSYGFDDGHHHDIHVRFVIRDGMLETEIEDDAKEYDPFTEAPEPDLDAGVDDRPIGGLGVFLVKEFMDRTEYVRTDGRNYTRLWKSIEEQES